MTPQKLLLVGSCYVLGLLSTLAVSLSSHGERSARVQRPPTKWRRAKNDVRPEAPSHHRRDRATKDVGPAQRNDGTPVHVRLWERRWQEEQALAKELCFQLDAEREYARMFGPLRVLPLAATVEEVDRRWGPETARILSEPQLSALKRLSARNSRIPLGADAKSWQALAYRIDGRFEVVVGRDVGRDRIESKALERGVFLYLGGAVAADAAALVRTLIQEHEVRKVHVLFRFWSRIRPLVHEKMSSGGHVRDVAGILVRQGRLYLIKDGESELLDRLRRACKLRRSATYKAIREILG